jgi:P4 family phage/plasmid primase-like protien
MTREAPPLVNADEVRRALEVLVAPGDVAEVRALDARINGERWGRPGVVSGYFDGPDALTDAVCRIDEAFGVYITLNPCAPELLARRANALGRAGKDDLTKDKEIARRRWLLIDLDAEKFKGISSTDAQLAAAREAAKQTTTALRDRGWPEPVVALSGNGYHVLYRLDLANDADALALVEGVLAGVAELVDVEGVKVDRSVANASRIVKLYGTAACKGSHTEERPHRLSRIIQAPKEAATPVTLEQLQDVAALAPKPEVKPARFDDRKKARGWSLESWIAEHLGGVAESPKEWEGGRKWTLSVCPFDDTHSRGEAFIIERSEGAIGAGCHHESCSWGWKELRAKFDPGREAKGLDALQAARETLGELDEALDGADLVAALGPLYASLVAVPAGALRDAAIGEVQRALRPRAKALTLRAVRAEVGRLARASSGADGAGVAFSLGSDVEVARHILDDLERDSEPLTYDRAHLWRYGTDAGLWARLEQHAVKALVADLDGVIVRAHDEEKARALRASARLMRDAYSVMRDLRARPGFFDGSSRGLSFSNGFLSAEHDTLVLRPHDPEQRATVGYDFAYDAEAHPCRFYNLLCEVWRDDDDCDQKIEVLREWVGAALLGSSTRFQRALMMVGTGANGKSTILDIVSGLFPPGAVSAVNPQDMDDEYRRALLAGSRLNCVSELPEAEIMSTEGIKALVSGDAITAREIREAPFRFRPEAGHLFSANSLPPVRDTSRGFWRRWIVLTFDREFRKDEQVRDLDRSVLGEERAAIVSWALRGAEGLFARGAYDDTKMMTDALEDWRQHADPVAAFIAEQYEVIDDQEFCDGRGTLAAVLYEEYRRWSNNEGHARMSSRTFGSRLKQMVRRKHTNKGALYGVRVVSSYLRAVSEDV